MPYRMKLRKEIKMPEIRTLDDIMKDIHALLLEIEKYQVSPFIPISPAYVCPVCKRIKTEENDIEAIKEMGECLSCDHCRMEAMEQRAYDEWKDQGCPDLPEGE